MLILPIPITKRFRQSARDLRLVNETNHIQAECERFWVKTLSGYPPFLAKLFQCQSCLNLLGGFLRTQDLQKRLKYLWQVYTHLDLCAIWKKRAMRAPSPRG